MLSGRCFKSFLHFSFLAFDARTRVVAPEGGRIIISEDSNDLVVKIIDFSRYDGRDPLFVHVATSVDFPFQSQVKIAVETSFFYMMLVIEFNFLYQQPCKSFRVRMPLFLFWEQAWLRAFV